MRWIALLLVFTGCSATRTKVTVTRVHGEPVISVEFFDRDKESFNYPSPAPYGVGLLSN